MKVIRTALIGLGKIAHGYDDNPAVAGRIRYPTHFSAIRRDKRFKLVAACDKDKKAREKFGRRVPQDVKIYSDYRALLAEKQPEFVIIATPTKTHYSICLAAMRAGAQAILCEKPIAYSLSDAQRIVRLARRKKIIFAVNYFRAFDPSYNRLIAGVKSRKWGRLRQIRVKYSRGIFNSATHFINLAERLAGLTRSVTAQAKKQKGPDPLLDFGLAMGGGVTANFRAMSSPGPAKAELNLIFSKGKLRIVQDRVVAGKFKIDINRSMLAVYDNFYQRIIGKKKLLSEPEEALHTLRVAVKAVESAQSGKTIKI